MNVETQGDRENEQLERAELSRDYFSLSCALRAALDDAHRLRTELAATKPVAGHLERIRELSETLLDAARELTTLYGPLWHEREGMRQARSKLFQARELLGDLAIDLNAYVNQINEALG